MSSESALHYVCTIEEARRLVDRQQDFWVSECWCRGERGGCSRSRSDVCLQFAPETEADPKTKRKRTRLEVEEILIEAEQKRLVARPFRDRADMEITAGICFCCDDCCGYFLHPEERCDKGEMIESTDMAVCDDCMACLEVCRFGARTRSNGNLQIDRDRCYGCGLCAAVCPIDCVTMVARA
ncbi:MAG: hypothetical protein FJY88_11485 [Candidatus Eisenbacteria bacterium]|nr:hypothetical protein [Candidatus Eisenbacteria bacterium]